MQMAFLEAHLPSCQVRFVTICHNLNRCSTVEKINCSIPDAAFAAWPDKNVSSLWDHLAPSEKFVLGLINTRSRVSTTYMVAEYALLILEKVRGNNKIKSVKKQG